MMQSMKNEQITSDKQAWIQLKPSASDLCGDPTVPMPGRKRRD
jgi:hypothetical protein